LLSSGSQLYETGRIVNGKPSPGWIFCGGSADRAK
jgi:hypothetical protein